MKKINPVKYVCVFVLLIIVTLLISKKIDDNKCVTFKDPVMQTNIYKALKDSSSLSKNFSKKHMTKGDLKKVKELTIIMWQDYTTLDDLKYCVNLKTLKLNSHIIPKEFANYKYQHDIDSEIPFDDFVEKNGLSDKKRDQFQTELSAVSPKLKKLKVLCVYGDALCQHTSLQFVASLPELETLHLFNLIEIKSFAPLRECTNIKNLTIEYCRISDSRDLLNFDYLESMYIWYTPLGQDEKEVRLLEKAYPDADINIYCSWSDSELKEYGNET